MPTYAEPPARGRARPKPKPPTIQPGETKAFQIADLDAVLRAYWLLPGEYTIAGDCRVAVSPAPKGTDDFGDGFGYVTLRFAPVKVQVMSRKGQGQLPLKRYTSKDFCQERVTPAAGPALHGDAVLAGMLF